MKKLLVWLGLIAGLFYFNFNVSALEFQEKELISTEEIATVETANFVYQDFALQSVTEGKGIIKFTNIVNKSDKKIPVSINLLLFDENKLNIGYLAYCTEKDLSSNYTDFKLEPKSQAPFSINIGSKYFVSDKSFADIKFISVMDENKYCHIGGYNKYEGLTLEQIKDGKVAANMGEKRHNLNLVAFLKDKGTMTLIVMGVLCLAALLLVGSVLNALYKRMFADTTAMAYIPILCNYVSVKLAFGSIIAKIYLILLFLGIGLFFVDINILLILLAIVFLVSFMINILKLIIKRYDLFYFEPTVKNNLKDSSTNVNAGSSNNSFTNEAFTMGSGLKKEETLDDDVVDLTYTNVVSNGGLSDDLIGLGQSSSSQISSGKGPLSNPQAFGEMLNQEGVENKQESSTSEGESDLTKFFK